MGRWHIEECKRLRDLALRVFLASVLFCICFCGAWSRYDVKAESVQDAGKITEQSAEMGAWQELARNEGSTTVTAYVPMEPETPPNYPDDSGNPDTGGEKDMDNSGHGGSSGSSGNAKTGDQNEIDHLIYIVMGSFIIMMCGIIILYVDNFKKKEDEC